MMRLLLAFLAGIALPLSVRLVGNRISLAASLGPVNTVFWALVNFVSHFAIYLLALVALLWPLRSWRRMIWITLAGSLGMAGTGLVMRIATDSPGAGFGWFVAQLPVLWLLTAYPMWLAIRLRAHWSPLRPGYCRHCSYNLTGNVSGVCPECGTEIEQP